MKILPGLGVGKFLLYDGVRKDFSKPISPASPPKETKA